MKSAGYYCDKREQWVYDYDSFEEEFWATQGQTPVAMLSVTAEELYDLFKKRLKEERESAL
jgi:hypothetical protein